MSDPQGILVEWDANLYILWCMRCVEVAICNKTESELRCAKCNYLLGKRITKEAAAEMQTTATCH